MHPRRSARFTTIVLLLALIAAPARHAAGYTWQRMGPRGGGAIMLAVDANPDTLYAATARGIFRSDDGGTSWTAAGFGFYTTDYVLGLGADPTTPGTVYAAATYQGYCGIHCVEVNVFIAKSTNGGASWSVLHSESAQNGYPNGGWMDRVAIAVDPTDPQTIHAGGWVRSGDGGSSWTPVTGMAATAWSVVVDPTNPQIVYAVTDFYSSGGIFKSTDGGLTFVSANANLGFTQIGRAHV